MADQAIGIRKYWVSSCLGTCQVNTDGTEHNLIVWTAPIWRTFVGQPFANLTVWLGRKGGATVVEI